MARFLNTNRRRVFVGVAALFMVLAATVGALNVRVLYRDPVVDPSAPEAKLLFEADAYWEKGDFVTAALLYVEVLDQYPQTPEASAAYDTLSSLDDEVRAKTITTEMLAEFDSKLAAIADLKSPKSKHTAIFFLLRKAEMLAEFEMKDLATETFKQGWDEGLALLQDFPDSEVHMYGAHLMLKTAGNLGKEYEAIAAQQLEEVIYHLGPCMASYASHYALVEYYLHNGRDREAAEEHIEALLIERDSKYIAAALKDPGTMAVMRGIIIYSFGYAELESGNPDAALAYFDKVEVDHPTAPMVSEWAALSRPAALRKIYPGQPEVLKEAYEDYLVAHPTGSERSWAYIKLGNIAMSEGDDVQAEAHYRQATQERPDPKPEAVAQDALRDIEAIREAPPELRTQLEAVHR